MLTFCRLKKRHEFLTTQTKGKKYKTSHFLVFVYFFPFSIDGSCSTPSSSQKKNIKIGYVASRKVGNAVKRNYAKRRLRSLTDHIFPNESLAISQDHLGQIYIVCVAFKSLVDASFQDLKNDFQRTIKTILSDQTFE